MNKKPINENKSKRKKIQEQFVEYKVKEKMPLLDFLLLNLKGKSRNNIKSLLKNHQILIDGNPTSQFDFLLVENDIVQVSPVRIKKSQNKTKLKIIYEDDDFLAIDKPSGLLSVASDKEKIVTAYHLASDYIKKDDPHKRLFVLHRIDKDTSGVLVFCKKEALRNALQDDWNIYVKTREYLALCEGEVKKEEDTIESYLLETKTNLMYSSSHVGDGQKAITHYKVIKKNKDYSLLRVLIDTGRKNQIRVHLKDINHMVVGDEKYHSEKNPINRLGLHAKKLVLVHPFTKAKITFISDTPKIFYSVFEH